MDDDHAAVADDFFQRRWSVLRSVDDMVTRLLDLLEAPAHAAAAANTFVIYSADNGYHLGEFGMIYDKRMLYESDVRVPLLVRGPGIGANRTIHLPATHIDLAPTILEMLVPADGAKPPAMDGRSWLPLARGDAAAAAGWRTEFMVEYSGGNPLPNGPAADDEGAAAAAHAHAEASVFSSAEVDARFGAELQAEATSFANSMPMRLLHAAPTATATATAKPAFCNASVDDETSLQGGCSCTVGRITGVRKDQSPCDGKNNTYSCFRTVVVASASAAEVAVGADVEGRTAAFSHNTMYCEFNDPEHFVELYDLNADPWSLRNLAPTTGAAALATLHARLLAHQACAGDGCFNPRAVPTPPPTPPTPAPTPAPIAAGAVQYSQGGACLQYDASAGPVTTHLPLTMGACAAAAAAHSPPQTWWAMVVGPKGSSSMRPVANASVCVNNADGTKCRAGTHFHLYGCPDGGGGPDDHPADLFHFDEATSTIVSEKCAGMCWVMGKDGLPSLGECADKSAKFEQIVHG